MAAPSVAINRTDLAITYNEFSLAANRRGYIGGAVLPMIGVMEEAASFSKVTVESLLTKVEDTKRKAKSTYARDDFTWTTDSYDVDEHGVEEVVDDATIERYGDLIRAEGIHTARAINRVLQALEKDIADAVFNTTTWTGASLTTAAGTPWTTHASATPIANILAAVQKVEESCGQSPNTVIMTKKALRNLKQCAEVKDLLKYWGGDDPKQLDNLSALATLLEVDQILVANAYRNTADRGQTAALSHIWNDTLCMVCRVMNDGMDGDLEAPEAHIGRSIFSTKNSEPLPGTSDDGSESLIIEEYREEARRGGVIRARNKRQVKILHAEAGHLISAVTA